MLQSPAKRRRTSVSSHVPVSNDDSAEATQPAPTIPRRASYLSPTKASLSRSHPTILADGRKGLLTEPKRAARMESVADVQSVVDKVKVNPQTEPRRSRSIDIGDGVQQKQQEQDRASAVPMAGSTEVTIDTFQPANEPKQNQQIKSIQARSPLLSRQSSTTTRFQSSPNDTEEAVIEAIIPKLVPKDSTNKRTTTRSYSNEPELPPTPVQLGLSPEPGRPRGLASSSSPGRSGRRQMRSRSSRSMISSPLKPKHTGSLPSPTPASGDIYSDASGVDEILDINRGDVGEADTEVIDLSEDVKDRRNLLASLLQEQKQLQQSLIQLGKLSSLVHDDHENDHHTDVLEETVAALNAFEPETQVDVTNVTKEPAFMRDPLPHLTLFAPGALAMTHTTSLTTVQTRRKVLHQITVSAPSPWPAEVFSLSFNVYIDPEDAQIDSISQMKTVTTSTTGSRTNLQRWITSRLDDPIHKMDIAGLIWGIGRYFEENVKRAKVFQTLSSSYATSQDEARLPTQKQSALGFFDRPSASVSSKEEALSLVPFLNTSQKTLFSYQRDSPRSANKRLMLIYAINLSWTGACAITVEIQTAGISLAAQQGGKEIFHRLMSSEGVVPAFQGVWDLLGLSHTSTNPQATTSGMRKRKALGT